MIRTFLFDMGNVLVHFCHDRMCQQMAALCNQPTAELKRHLVDAGGQIDFERGTQSPDQFHRWFETTFNTNVSRPNLARAASDIFTLNEPIVPVLDELKSRGYRLVLLSNTSIFHYEFIRDNFRVLDRFDDFVLSFEVQAVKPESAIYEAALNKIGCDPAECFYTDDIARYVEAARHYGIDAEVFTDVDNLKMQLAVRGIVLRGGVIV